MQFSHAIVRIPGSNFAGGLSTQSHGLPDFPAALEQHSRYCQALESCGLRLTVLDPDLRYPDSTFVEDTAILVKECAILTRPGAASRQGEVDAIRSDIQSAYDRVDEIHAPGTLDGGDVCEMGTHFLIGVSERTNAAGAGQLAGILNRFGYTADIVDIRGLPGLLHLKSGLAHIGENTLVVTEALAGCSALSGYTLIKTDTTEEYAANCIRVNDRILVAAGYPKMHAALQDLGYSLVALEMSEYQKMDGGLSCLSLRF